MKISFYVFFLSFIALAQKVVGQSLYSFEGKNVPEEWTTDKGSKLLISNHHFKDSAQSLQLNWKANSAIEINNFKNLKEDSKNPSSVFWGWVYNALPSNDSIQFVFKDESGVERANFYFKINFTGWRFMWICYARDLRYQFSKIGQPLTNVSIVAPKTSSGTLYFDMFESRPSSGANWHRSNDKQYTVGEPKADARVKAYDYEPSTTNINIADDAEVLTLKNKVYQWFVGDDQAYANNPIYQTRMKAVEKSIVDKKTVRWAIIKKLKFREINDGVASTVVADTLDAKTNNYIGVGLHGDMTGYGYLFNDVNNGFLFDMGLCVARYKGNDAKLKQRMIDSVTRVMDWMYDQGYAEGSGLGSGLTQLRSAGFPFAFFFIHQYITDNAKYERYLNAIRWIARDSYDTTKPGSSADDIRGSMLSKLVYALCIKDPKKRLAEMQYFKGFAENSLSIASGYYGLIKPDFSVYHHMMPYYSEYGDDAIHQGAVVLYLLHDTKFALSQRIYNNIRNAVLNLTDVACNYEVPAGVSGRFPFNGRNIIEQLPALAYLGLSTPDKNKRDIRLERAFVRLYRAIKDNPVAVGMDKAAMAIQYSQSLGAAIALIKHDAKVPQNVDGQYSLTKFLPYSGLHVAKYNNWSFSIKGFSKYITDFECIRNEGRFSRYLSYGHFQLMNSLNNWNSYLSNQSVDYIHFNGATTIALPLSKIDTRGKGNSAKERNYGDETFLGGVAFNDTIGMTAFKLHDNVFNNSFRAKKSVFHFGNLVYFMGSGIENNDAQNETHTTLFQNVADQLPLQLNATTVKDSSNISLVNNINVLKNSWNNTYIIYPQEGTSLHVEKRLQHNPNPEGKMPAKSSLYEIAWFNHSTNPSAKKYNYALLLNEDARVQAQLVNTKNPLIKVLQQDEAAHIIQTNVNGKEMYGYALFQPISLGNNAEPISTVSTPCIVMATITSSSIEMVFSNPDLNRPSVSDATAHTLGKPLITEVIIRGKYQVANADVGVWGQPLSDGNTKLKIESLNGSSYRILLKK